MVMMPLILIGSLVGAYVYVSFPDLIIQIILTVLLLILMLESGRKFIETYKKESKALKAAEAEPNKDGLENPKESEIASIMKVSPDTGTENKPAHEVKEGGN